MVERHRARARRRVGNLPRVKRERLDTELAVSHPERGGSLREGNAGVCRAARTITCESGSMRRFGRRSDSGSLARTCFLRVRGVRNDAVAPALLRQIERLVGAAQQLFGFLGVIGECGNPEGDGDGPERLIAIPKLELCNFLTKL